ncbi:hypothetical protein ACFV1H_17810 [Streptomyces virginiae]|uniref:hypothetical protein n=1 Tax=Streptomyces virginiae TaxID=1961 RepID=UPI00369C8302
MPNWKVTFVDRECGERVVNAARLVPESRDGFDVYAAYKPGAKAPFLYLTGAHVLSVEETVVPRGKLAGGGSGASE